MPVQSKRRSSHARIDILIPAIEKDLRTLPHVIDAARAQVKHPIGHIRIIAPWSRRMIELCRAKNCVFINENHVLPITKRDIHYRSSKWELSGWLFQQLLKLSGDTVCTSKYFLVLDADTVLIRPHVFRIGSKTVFYCRNWSQPEYFRTYRRLLGKKPAKPSFVTHYMLFERAKLAQLKRTIEARHRTSWYRAIMRKMDRTRKYAFSEFETYGHYMYASNRSGMIIRQARNKSMSVKIGRFSRLNIKKLARSYRSISFHERKGYVRKLRGNAR